MESWESVWRRRDFEEIFLKSFEISLRFIRMMPYFWCIELYSDVERKLSIGGRKIVGASGCITNEIRIGFILEGVSKWLRDQKDTE